MHGRELRQVPIRLDAQRWSTRTGCKTVLVVVHTVTTGQRLAGILRLFESDLRVQVVFTAAPDVFGNGVSGLLRKLDGIVIPWSQATSSVFDLALAAAYGGLHDLHAPVIAVPHGAGYNKLAVRRDLPGAVTAARGAYGLDPQSLVQGGRVIPAAIVLAHRGDLTILGRQCPEALPAAEVAGDPCYDQLLVSRPWRDAYRRAMHIGPETRLVVTTSTWGPQSLFAQAAEVHDRMLAELPSSQYRVVALMHPNIWYGHGPRQVRAWLGSAMKRGLSLVAPSSEWLGALTAADVAIADHGSAGVYAAAAGRPVLWAGGGKDDLVPGSAADLLARAAPQLRMDQALERQVASALDRDQAGLCTAVAERLTSEPGRFDRRMRRLLYRMLGLSQPPAVLSTPPTGPPSLIGWER
jgi:hypothetical protein